MSGIQNLLLGGSPVAAAAGDPDFEYVTLLLPGNGTNGAQNNTFLDSSTNNFTITRNGNTTQGTFSPFSQTGWSNYFDGSTDYLSTTSTQILPTGDFTIEAFIYFTGSFSTYPSIFAQGTSGNAGRTNFYLDTSGKLGFAIGTTVATSTGTVTANAWNYVAVTRSGSTVTFYINGSSSGTATNSGTPQNTSIRIGLDWNAGEEFTGYISNLRISDNVRTITSTPTTPYSSDGNTKLLTCQSNRFVDNSSNGYALTVNGTPSVQAFSPFNPTAAWSAATNGGSGYFDGTGDYLSTSTSQIIPATGDFTLEAWVYPTSISSYPTIFNQGTAGTTGRCRLYIDTSAVVTLQVSGSTVSSTATVKLNQWNYIAATRSGSSVSIYVNGAAAATGTLSGSIENTTLKISNDWESPTYGVLTGYISAARISTSIRSSLTTVPTAPFADDANTKLLLNFTNAGIYDAASKNDLETVGNAQISTTQSKFGGSSMYFDGTGDYLKGNQATSNLYALEGDFTIEMWVYSGSYTETNAAYPTMYATSDYNGTGIGVKIQSNGGIGTAGCACVWYNGSQILTGTTDITTNTWTHVAVSRSGSTIRLFVNGTQQASTTNTASFTVSSGYPLIGADTTARGYFNGYIDDLRITKGYARYTANFTAPTAAFPLF